MLRNGVKNNSQYVKGNAKPLFYLKTNKLRLWFYFSLLFFSFCRYLWAHFLWHGVLAGCCEYSSLPSLWKLKSVANCVGIKRMTVGTETYLFQDVYTARVLGNRKDDAQVLEVSHNFFFFLDKQKWNQSLWVWGDLLTQDVSLELCALGTFLLL